MVKDSAYYPSIWHFSKIPKYFYYFWEYLKWQDYRSLLASVRYLLLHKSSDKSWISISEMGKFRIRANTSDFQFVNIAYESGVKNYLKNLIPKMTYFVDVGACMGEYNVWLARHGVTCFAFEPVNYASLEENVRLNGLEEKITTYRCGIGAVKEKVTFAVMKTVTSSSHIDRTQGEGNVDIDTLDNIFAGFTLPDTATMVIKFDVEGMETEAIEGAQHFLSKCNNLHIIYERFATTDDIVEKKLDQLGKFRHQRLDDVNYVAIRMN